MIKILSQGHYSISQAIQLDEMFIKDANLIILEDKYLQEITLQTMHSKKMYKK